MGFLVSLVMVYILGVGVGGVGDQKGLPCYSKELFHIKKKHNYLKIKQSLFISFLFYSTIKCLFHKLWDGSIDFVGNIFKLQIV